MDPELESKIEAKPICQHCKQEFKLVSNYKGKNPICSPCREYSLKMEKLKRKESIMKKFTESLFKTFYESAVQGYLESWDDDWTKDGLEAVFEKIKEDPKLKKKFIEYLKM